MASGSSVINNYLLAADTRSTLAAIRALGAEVELEGATVKITGVGLRGLAGNSVDIDVGNSGTLIRVLPAWLAGQTDGSWELDGDDSIRRRPMDRVLEPLRKMGANISARENRYAPISVRGGALKGIQYELPVASAQVKTCVLLAGLLADGETSVIESVPSRDHTERMLLKLGVPISRESVQSKTANQIAGADQVTGRSIDHKAATIRITVRGVDKLSAATFNVPADASSAAFHLAAAAIIPGSHVRVENVGTNWTRAGFLHVLKRMGADLSGDIESLSDTLTSAEPASTLELVSAPLQGTTVEANEVPLMIDELPLVALLGCFADGETIVRGAEELRVKETDRIAATVQGIRAIGGSIEATTDGFVVTGTGGIRGGMLDSHADHRLAMLGAIAGLASTEGVEVAGMEAAAVSYPNFSKDLRSLVS